MARRGHHFALKTIGGSKVPLEPGFQSAGGAAASESGENIVMKDEGEGGSADEVRSLDMRIERIEVVGDRRSESSRDLELDVRAGTP